MLLSDSLCSSGNLKQEQASFIYKKELRAPRNLITELDNLIQKLFENQINATIPERQGKRLISQYDEEQVQFDSRVSVLKAEESEAAPKKADINSSVALIWKYKNITELSDEMLNDFNDKVMFHAPNDKKGNVLQQKLDIYFNVIGKYLPPMLEITEGNKPLRLRQSGKLRRKPKKRESWQGRETSWRP